MRGRAERPRRTRARARMRVWRPPGQLDGCRNACLSCPPCRASKPDHRGEGGWAGHAPRRGAAEPTVAGVFDLGLDLLSTPLTLSTPPLSCAKHIDTVAYFVAFTQHTQTVGSADNSRTLTALGGWQPRSRLCALRCTRVALPLPVQRRTIAEDISQTPVIERSSPQHARGEQQRVTHADAARERRSSSSIQQRAQHTAAGHHERRRPGLGAHGRAPARRVCTSAPRGARGRRRQRAPHRGVAGGAQARLAARPRRGGRRAHEALARRRPLPAR